VEGAEAELDLWPRHLTGLSLRPDVSKDVGGANVSAAEIGGPVARERLPEGLQGRSVSGRAVYVGDDDAEGSPREVYRTSATRALLRGRS